MHVFIFKCAQCHEPIVMNLEDEGVRVDGFITFPNRFLAEMALETEKARIMSERKEIIHMNCGSMTFDVGEFELKLV